MTPLKNLQIWLWWVLNQVQENRAENDRCTGGPSAGINSQPGISTVFRVLCELTKKNNLIQKEIHINFQKMRLLQRKTANFK